MASMRMTAYGLVFAFLCGAATAQSCGSFCWYDGDCISIVGGACPTCYANTCLQMTCGAYCLTGFCGSSLCGMCEIPDQTCVPVDVEACRARKCTSHDECKGCGGRCDVGGSGLCMVDKVLEEERAARNVTVKPKPKPKHAP